MDDTHSLKDPWFLSFIPHLTTDAVKYDYKGDWALAKQKLQQPLDYIRTVEELWSTVNSLPKLHQLGNGSTFVLARNNIDASYEAFPNGARVFVDLYNATVTEKAVDVILSAILGEAIARDACDGNSICDVLRLSSRPSHDSPELVRLEVWLSDQTYTKSVAAYIKKSLQEAVTPFTGISIAESSFENKAVKNR